MQARDVMNTKLIYVTPGTSLKKVIQTLIKNDISGVPVVNRAKHLGVPRRYEVLADESSARVIVGSTR